ncbi:MAG: hypothetical protein AB1768_17785 [Pseudomonadota bacterium]
MKKIVLAVVVAVAVIQAFAGISLASKAEKIASGRAAMIEAALK